uniref:Golgi SNAP receptor complex member 1 n=1 Tax=Cyclophora tenuis TaxID=216820 RepID=A0A7S1D086_CYCTE|mmetsp:Transcript_14307/g.24302  ORF Transcript_14307/g.24302 Transcript_14307/m.24302 type:complete len:232 (+) Transcript_14307:291-986(+)|eukprot:CAMPEP_0116564276 /NCGR_PEP_ID=MMETSP0397-20121206/13215_1 /TAXON_ID=216820 /ORGANISM="Cyclophora tenuis, Strain ECT3854" /LENGTH=231 /DNA_ID=CAMNT_0004090845 /DNA_START=288 /DNA_END=983 /DNA_ORIENTATION=-
MQDFDVLRREATKLERHLEERVSRYQQLSQKLAAVDGKSDSLMHSLENGTHLDEETSLRNDIQRTLSTLQDLIQTKLSPAAEQSGKSQHMLMVKRYREILFDLTSDFQKTSTQIQRKKQQFELFQGANMSGSGQDENDPAMEQLLRERNHINNSLTASSSVIAQASEIHSDLKSQGMSLRGVTGTLVKITSQVPGLNRLMENIRRKKARDDLIVSIVIALCIVFTLWYIFG